MADRYRAVSSVTFMMLRPPIVVWRNSVRDPLRDIGHGLLPSEPPPSRPIQHRAGLAVCKGTSPRPRALRALLLLSWRLEGASSTGTERCCCERMGGEGGEMSGARGA